MSFFDEGDEPRTVRAPRAPRRSSGARRSPRDQQSILIRRAVALGALLLVAILLVAGVRSCVGGAAKRGLSDYNRSVGEIVGASDSRLSQPLFSSLKGAADRAQPSATDVQNRLNDLRAEADGQLSRAERLSVPDELKGAHRDLLLVLELRRDGVASIARQIQPALGSSGGPAIAAIAGQMAQFLASDVVYSQHVAPLLREKLEAKGVGVGPAGEVVAASRFLGDLGWLDPSFVKARLTGGASPAAPKHKPAPGSHGHALTSVTVGAMTLTAGGSPTRISATPPPTFTVKVQNQGQNDETEVPVKVSVTGAGAPIEATKAIRRSPANQPSSVRVTLPGPPPIGRPVSVKVTVGPVPGEKTVSNNTQTYPVVFGG